jgi:hypothetical protein
MLISYFEIIRKALSENRKKDDGIYYEAHHIVPECLSEYGKKSSTVLLTAREHYRVHKILAECFKDHPLYKYKFLWAFHRMTYSGDLELSEEEYAVAREALMKLWKREKTKSHRENIGIKLKGNKNGVGGKKDWVPTQEQRKRYSEAATKRQLGKVGEDSRASKGAVVYENDKGERIEAGSAHQLSKIVGIKTSTMIYRMKEKEGQVINGYKVYYKK